MTIISRSRVAFAVLGFLLGTASYYLIGLVFSPTTVRQQHFNNSRELFLQAKCLDENRKLLRNDDGLIIFRCLDRNAEMSQHGDRQTVKNLADAVFGLTEVPGASELIARDSPDTIIDSEISYRTGYHPGASNEDVTRAFNNLMRRLRAPEYALTDEKEVRRLRESLNSEMPHFFERDGPMSPLQLIYLVDFLMYQKALNDTFLLTPAERTYSEVSGLTDREKRSNPKNVKMNTDSARVKEMSTLFKQAGAANITRLRSECFNELEIPK